MLLQGAQEGVWAELTFERSLQQPLGLCIKRLDFTVLLSPGLAHDHLAGPQFLAGLGLLTTWQEGRRRRQVCSLGFPAPGLLWDGQLVGQLLLGSPV